MCSFTKVVETAFAATPSGVAFVSEALPFRENFVRAWVRDKEF